MIVEVGGDRREALEKYCLCGVNVHTATKILMWLKIIFGVLSCLALVFVIVTLSKNVSPAQEESLRNLTNIPITVKEVARRWCYLYIISTAIPIILYILVLYGITNKQPNLYNPHLIFTVMKIAIVCIGAVLTYFRIGLIGTKGRMWINEFLGGSFAKFGAGLGIYIFLNFYFNFLIIRRSKELLKAEKYDLIPPAYNTYV